LIGIYYYQRLSTKYKLRLRRGPILLIAGGAIMAIGFAIFTYYTVLFATKLLAENKYNIEPADATSVERFISKNATEGTYIVALVQAAGQPGLKITDPAGQVLVDKQLEGTLSMDTFGLTQDGNYTLTVANTSPDSALEANIVFGDQKSIIESGLDINPVTLSVMFNFTLYAGIAVFVAGVIITVLDRQRTSKMKQFGDTSDLV
jgi:uncharacterized repeat protein (TIGR01451 family)